MVGLGGRRRGRLFARPPFCASLGGSRGSRLRRRGAHFIENPVRHLAQLPRPLLLHPFICSGLRERRRRRDEVAIGAADVDARAVLAGLGCVGQCSGGAVEHRILVEASASGAHRGGAPVPVLGDKLLPALEVAILHVDINADHSGFRPGADADVDCVAGRPVLLPIVKSDMRMVDAPRRRLRGFLAGIKG